LIALRDPPKATTISEFGLGLLVVLPGPVAEGHGASRSFAVTSPTS
jgi:hypothetical protein